MCDVARKQQAPLAKCTKKTDSPDSVYRSYWQYAAERDARIYGAPVWEKSPKPTGKR